MKPVSFLKEVKQELDRVVWPTKTEVLELTILVIVVSVLVGAYVGGLDLLFTSLMDRILGR